MHEKACFKIDTNMKRHYLKVLKNSSCILYVVMEDKLGNCLNVFVKKIGV